MEGEKSAELASRVLSAHRRKMITSDRDGKEVKGLRACIIADEPNQHVRGASKLASGVELGRRAVHGVRKLAAISIRTRPRAKEESAELFLPGCRLHFSLSERTAPEPCSEASERQSSSCSVYRLLRWLLRLPGEALQAALSEQFERGRKVMRLMRGVRQG